MSQSAAYFVIFGAMVTALVLSMRRHARTTKDDSTEARPSRLSRLIVWEGAYSQAFQRALDVLAALGAQITSADPNRGTIEARIDPSPLAAIPFGAHVRVTLATQDGVTSVELGSSAVVRPFGTPGAARLLEDFTNAWDRLPAPRPATQS